MEEIFAYFYLAGMQLGNREARLTTDYISIEYIEF